MKFRIKDDQGKCISAEEINDIAKKVETPEADDAGAFTADEIAALKSLAAIAGDLQGLLNAKVKKEADDQRREEERNDPAGDLGMDTEEDEVAEDLEKEDDTIEDACNTKDSEDDDEPRKKLIPREVIDSIVGDLEIALDEIVTAPEVYVSDNYVVITCEFPVDDENDDIIEEADRVIHETIDSAEDDIVYKTAGDYDEETGKYHIEIKLMNHVEGSIGEEIVDTEDACKTDACETDACEDEDLEDVKFTDSKSSFGSIEKKSHVDDSIDAEDEIIQYWAKRYK